MSNTSYSFKENSHLLVNQGGEKKVMKKILSVALSTAMAFSMFASVAFGAEANLSPEQQFNALKEAGIVTGYPDGLSHLERTLTRAELAKIVVNAIALEPVTGVATYKDKNYSASHWAAPYIEAATAAGILQGKDTVKGLFDPSGNVTVQELAKVLVTALELEVPADAENTASPWAKGYVAAAVEAGFIAEGINYQAAATRSQAVVAAYAIYENAQVPSVASYTVSEGGKVVEFKLSNDEVVKVELETALAPNKETEVKFTHNGVEYTEKVTYVTTVAQTVQSVKAEDLKQIVVTFDGTVDAKTAGEIANYTIDGKSFDSAEVSEDKTSVTLLLDKVSVLTNQKQVEISLNNVKNEDGTKTFSQKVQFTPIDVTAPTVKEVVGLGTKAFKIKFSEPVKEADAITSANYRIDGKVIGAAIKYAYPDTVIVSTQLEEGEHTLRVSGVADFSGLSVAPVENTFTTVVDTEAPEIESVKADDLTKVVVTFNETIKSVGSAYANTSSKTATKIEINDNKVTLSFDGDSKRLNQGENTVVLKGVSDYSGNSADREAKVTPELDTVRPEVTNFEFKKDGANYVAELQFSKTLNPGTATDAENYKLVDADGKVAKIAGVNNDGNPVRTIGYNSTTKKVTLNFGPVFDKEYTLEISGVRDNAFIGNEIIPYSVKLNPEGTEQGEISRVWIDDAITADGGKYVYVEFNAPIALSGNGSALDPAKYSFSTPTDSSKVRLTTKADDVEPVTSSSVRIYTEKEIAKGHTLYADYIANTDGKYLTGSDASGNNYTLSKVVTAKNASVTVDSVEATGTKTLKVKFDAALNVVNPRDFVVEDNSVTGVTYAPNDYTLSNDGKTLELKFADSQKLPASFDASRLTLTAAGGANSVTRDTFGNPVAVDEAVSDKIAPEVTDVFSFASNVATFTTTEEIRDNVNGAFLNSLFKVEVTDEFGVKNDVSNITVTASGTTITVSFTTARTVGANDYVHVALEKNAGAITDLQGNDLKDFSKNVR